MLTAYLYSAPQRLHCPSRAAKVAGTATDRSGLVYFFDADTFDATVKVLNSCSINNRYWVFASAATDVEYTLTVTDTKAGRTAAP